MSCPHCKGISGLICKADSVMTITETWDGKALHQIADQLQNFRAYRCLDCGAGFYQSTIEKLRASSNTGDNCGT